MSVSVSVSVSVGLGVASSRRIVVCMLVEQSSFSTLSVPASERSEAWVAYWRERVTAFRVHPLSTGPDIKFLAWMTVLPDLASSRSPETEMSLSAPPNSSPRRRLT